MSQLNPVIVYSTTNCPHCNNVKNFLKEKGVAYEERNIETNDTYGEELWATGHRSVPVTVIDDAKILGFNVTQLNKKLAARQESQA